MHSYFSRRYVGVEENILRFCMKMYILHRLRQKEIRNFALERNANANHFGTHTQLVVNSFNDVCKKGKNKKKIYICIYHTYIEIWNTLKVDNVNHFVLIVK